MPNKYSIVLFVSILIWTNTLFSQVKKLTRPVDKKSTSIIKPEKERPYTKWSLKAGGNISVIYLARNVKENNNEPGYCGGLTYEVNNFVRVATLYSRFRPINIEPTWLDVKANTYEMNMEILAKFPNRKTLLYPFFGLSYNMYSGYFTGESDFLNLSEYYPVNSTVKNNWTGLNFGVGLEHNFGILGLFIDYRMRVGKQETAINIMDVCYTGGLKVRFPYGNLAKKLGSPNDRFHWF
ncbi:MAG: hypothetical protein K0S53_3079 [Bacteroidetes bacterium]|jgi:hypothetical protein|nr:hypothetical protein [Bacteroidota bacterium]MDF2453708.1 hypothetical protein [Bacteroidota bacterium]